MKYFVLTVVAILLLVATVEASWIFLPSTYSHMDGQRVDQYMKPKKRFTDGKLTRTIYTYRHIHIGNSHTHIQEFSRD